LFVSVLFLFRGQFEFWCVYLGRQCFMHCKFSYRILRNSGY
jgi:hypothetical protein